MLKIYLIYAASINNVIGQDGGIPWRLPPDLKRFRELTEGDAVVMGRKTYESLPVAVRPLPMRRNIVVSRTLKAEDVPEDVSVIDDMEKYIEALIEAKRASRKNFQEKQTIWVIGGKEVLQAFSKIADGLFITRVYQNIPIDENTVRGPSFVFGEWEADGQDRPLTYRWEEPNKDGPPIQKRLTYQFQFFKRKK